MSFLENPTTPHFHGFRFFGRVHDSQNELSSTLETPGYSKRRIPDHFQNNMLGNLKCLEIQSFENVGKDVSTILEGPSDIFLKILNMGSISSKNEMEIW